MGKLEVVVGNIVSDDLLKRADAIVNPTNPAMLYGGGACGAIFNKAGVEELENYTKKQFNIFFDGTYKNLMQVTEVRITPGFKIPCDIIFAQGPKVWDTYSYEEAENLLLKTYENVVKEAVKRGYKNILMPSLGTGIYGFHHEKVAKKVMELLQSLIKEKPLNIVFVVYESENFDVYNQYLIR